ncbi:hypothetical protein KSS87_001490, partial [Heliosperma pusillum]
MPMRCTLLHGPGTPSLSIIKFKLQSNKFETIQIKC